MTKDVNITIGGSLNALQWAYQHGTRLIINKPSFPPPYEPSDKKLAWGLLYYKLMMDGKIIGGDYVNAVRIDDDEIIVACKNNIINRTTYNKVTLFMKFPVKPTSFSIVSVLNLAIVSEKSKSFNCFLFKFETTAIFAGLLM